MGKTALIVEDEIFVALDLERILMEAGYSVCAIAPDSETAMAAAPACDFALVDVNLRDGCTGPVIARWLAEHGVRVVFVTANPGQIGRPAHGLGYVRKPFCEAAILAAAKLAEAEDRPAANDDLQPIGRGGAIPG